MCFNSFSKIPCQQYCWFPHETCENIKTYLSCSLILKTRSIKQTYTDIDTYVVFFIHFLLYFLLSQSNPILWPFVGIVSTIWFQRMPHQRNRLRNTKVRLCKISNRMYHIYSSDETSFFLELYSFNSLHAG